LSKKTTSDRKLIDTELETAIEERADLITCNNYNTVLSVKDHGEETSGSP